MCIRDRRSGDGTVRTDHRYSNFVLELKWRPLRETSWDSGIYIRCELPAAGQPWPERYQINLLKGHEGNIVGVPAAQSKGLVKPGMWNQFRLTLIGKQATLEINGQQAWQVDAIESAAGYIAFQSEVDGGGQFEFKDIFVTELDHQTMFNGQDLSGWQGAGQDAKQCWKVDDGTRRHGGGAPRRNLDVPGKLLAPRRMGLGLQRCGPCWNKSMPARVLLAYGSAGL